MSAHDRVLLHTTACVFTRPRVSSHDRMCLHTTACVFTRLLCCFIPRLLWTLSIGGDCVNALSFDLLPTDDFAVSPPSPLDFQHPSQEPHFSGFCGFVNFNHLPTTDAHIKQYCINETAYLIIYLQHSYQFYHTKPAPNPSHYIYTYHALFESRTLPLSQVSALKRLQQMVVIKDERMLAVDTY